MFKLYGVKMSNYYNMVKLALLEKGFDFEEVMAMPDDLAKMGKDNPMAKMPVLQCREGFIAETTAILEFLEDAESDLPLLPQFTYQRAKVRQCIQYLDHYVEVIARKHYGYIFFGGPKESEQVIAETLAMAKRGMAAVDQLVSADEWLFDEFSYADIYGFFVMQPLLLVGEKVWGWDVAADYPWVTPWMARMRERPMLQVTLAEFDKAFAQYVAFKKAQSQ